MMNATHAYFIMYQGGICQVTFVLIMLSLTVTDKINIEVKLVMGLPYNIVSGRNGVGY